LPNADCQKRSCKSNNAQFVRAILIEAIRYRKSIKQQLQSVSSLVAYYSLPIALQSAIDNRQLAMPRFLSCAAPASATGR
jgi:hypothetical protein